MVWPFSRKTGIKETVKNVSEDIKLKYAFTNHERHQTPQSHLQLLQELNTSKYYVAMQDDQIEYSTNPVSGHREVSKESKIKFILAADPAGFPLLTLFSNREELEAWAKDKAGATWVLSPQEAWGLALGWGIGIIINPVSVGWLMGKEHIEWLQKNPL